MMRRIYRRSVRAARVDFSSLRSVAIAAAVPLASLLVPPLATLLAPRQALAQSPVVSPAAIGMGHAAYDGLACGADALAANPAALARDCAAPLRLLVLPTLAFEAMDNGAGGLVWRHRRALLDAIDRQSFADAFDPAVGEEILARIPPEGYRHRNRVHAPLVQAGIGSRSALSVSFTAAGHGVIARDLAELALRGYEEGRTAYSFRDTDEHGVGYWTLAIGHGRTIGGFDVGVTARAISGTFLTRWRAFDPTVDIHAREVRGRMVGAFTGDNLFSGNLIGFRPPDGLGWGIDMGAMREVGRVRLGFAVHNVAHNMTWSEDIFIRTLTLTGALDGTRFDTEDSVYDPADSSRPDAIQVAAGIRSTAYFPRRTRASAAYAPGSRVTLGFGAAFNNGDGDLDRDWDQRYSVGAMVRPAGFLRFQAGLAADLEGAQELSGGFELDLGRTRFGAGAVRVTETDGLAGWRAALGVSRF